MIRALVVDDERLAREGLCGLLRSEADVDVVGLAIDGRDALTKIRTLAPNLVFLDVQMPELDGFGVVRGLATGRAPGVIFVTAHGRYALDAFGVDAVDYLLKPFDRARLRGALAKARRYLAAIADDPGARAPSDTQPAARLRLKDRGRVTCVDVRDVSMAVADGNYVRVAVNDTTYLVRDTLGAFERRLGREHFVRVSRSAVVRIDQVAALHSASGGRYRIVLTGGRCIESSRRYRAQVRAILIGTRGATTG